MKLISIDVGIKNLAYCLFSLNEENKYIIDKWGIIDLSQKTEIQKNCTCCNEKKPTKKNPNPIKEKCKYQAKWKRENEYFCVKHAKQSGRLTQLKMAFVNKQNMISLNNILDKLNIKEKPSKKADMISVIQNYIEKECLQPIEEVNACKMDLVTIGKNMKIKFNNIFSQIVIDKVIIENQISPIASKMKTIQGMISQYFIMITENPIEIDFVNSSNKLKIGESLGKTEYKERKQQAIKIVRETIDNTWLEFFNKHSKKDDLADCYLQGLWYIQNKIN